MTVQVASSSPLSNYLYPDLWNICESYLPKAEVLNFWSVLGNPEKGFARMSAAIYQLFKEKVALLPLGHPLTDWYRLHQIYQQTGVNWTLKSEFPIPRAKKADGEHPPQWINFQMIEEMTQWTNFQMISKNRAIFNEATDLDNCQYFVYDLSHPEKNPIPLGKTHQRMHSEAAFVEFSGGELSTEEIALVPINVFYHERFAHELPITLWKFQPSKEPDFPDRYECIAESAPMRPFPVNMKGLSQRRLVCVFPDGKIRIFNDQLKSIFEYSTKHFCRNFEVTTEGNLVIKTPSGFYLWSLRGTEALEIRQEKYIKYQNEDDHFSTMAILQDGRIVSADNSKNTSRLSIWNFDSGEGVIYPLEVREIVTSLSQLETGEIVCGISSGIRKYCKIWPPNHSNHPREEIEGCDSFQYIANFGLARSIIYDDKHRCHLVVPQLPEGVRRQMEVIRDEEIAKSEHKERAKPSEAPSKTGVAESQKCCAIL